jgi:hypothetical protein
MHAQEMNARLFFWFLLGFLYGVSSYDSCEYLCKRKERNSTQVHPGQHSKSATWLLYMGNFIENKLNKTLKFNYQTTQCLRVQ